MGGNPREPSLSAENVRVWSAISLSPQGVYLPPNCLKVNPPKVIVLFHNVIEFDLV